MATARGALESGAGGCEAGGAGAAATATGVGGGAGAVGERDGGGGTLETSNPDAGKGVAGGGWLGRE